MSVRATVGFCPVCGNVGEDMEYDNTPCKSEMWGTIYYSTKSIQRCRKCGEILMSMYGNSQWSENSPQGQHMKKLYDYYTEVDEDQKWIHLTEITKMEEEHRRHQKTSYKIKLFFRSFIRGLRGSARNG